MGSTCGPRIRWLSSRVGLASDLTFLHAELTKSAHVPRLEQFKEMAATSYQAAIDGARTHGEA